MRLVNVLFNFFAAHQTKKVLQAPNTFVTKSLRIQAQRGPIACPGRRAVPSHLMSKLRARPWQGIWGWAAPAVGGRRGCRGPKGARHESSRERREGGVLMETVVHAVRS